jgi:hypothetical protein
VIPIFLALAKSHPKISPSRIMSALIISASRADS